MRPRSFGSLGSFPIFGTPSPSSGHGGRMTRRSTSPIRWPGRRCSMGSRSFQVGPSGSTGRRTRGLSMGEGARRWCCPLGSMRRILARITICLSGSVRPAVCSPRSQDGADAQPGRFLTRNRLIAALGRSTIVVQAPSRSGALSTARFAKRLGRPVFAVPASPWDPRGSGNLSLLSQGGEDLRASRRCPIGDGADGERPTARVP